MGEEGESAVRLLASHLAKVKLGAEETKYQLEGRISGLENQLEDALEQLDANQRDIENYRKQVKELQGQNTYKALAAEREKWKTLIDTLRNDKKGLAAQVEILRAQLGVTDETSEWERSSLSQNTENETNKANGPKTVRSGSNEKSEVVALMGEVEFLKTQLQAKEVEVMALRSKLDAELELKWERTHGSQAESNGWQKSLLESFVEVLAPLPSSAINPDPLSPTTSK